MNYLMGRSEAPLLRLGIQKKWILQKLINEKMLEIAYEVYAGGYITLAWI
jgi:hypothetical protein